MFKAIIISNPQFLQHGSDVTGFVHPILDKLLDFIYQSKRYCSWKKFGINMTCYETVVDLLLFVIECHKLVLNDKAWGQESFIYIVDMLNSTKQLKENGSFIQIMQWSILRIVLDECISTATTSWEKKISITFRSVLMKLIERNRSDIILPVYRHARGVDDSFNESINNTQTNMNTMMRNEPERELINTFIEEKPLNSSLDKILLFLLLLCKDYILIGKLFNLPPSTVHLHDEDIDNSFISECSKICDCRHQIAEFLITMGCDVERQHFEEKHLIDALQRGINRELFSQAMEDEEDVLKIDNISGEIQVALARQLSNNIPYDRYYLVIRFN